MEMTDQSSLLRAFFEVKDCGLPDAVVARFRVDESHFEPGRASVSLVTTEPPDPEELLGGRATLRIERAGGDRCFHGIVWACRTQPPRGTGHEWAIEVEIRPRLAALSLGRGSRSFQAKSVPEIVTDVLTRRGITADEVTWMLKDRYPARAWTVQLGECDLDFISRLLFDEGIGFVVDHEDGSDRLVFFDAPPDTPIQGTPELSDRDGTRLGHDVVYDLVQSFVVRSDEVVLRDYDYLHPRLDITARERLPGSVAAEVYAHPGGYADPADGKRRARKLLERIRVDARTLTGSSDCARLVPGRVFVVQGPARAEMSGSFVVVSAVHEGALDRSSDEESQPVYRCRFEAVPAETPLRPRAAPAKPVVGGVHLGFATTPPAEEIHCDEHARSTARFVWDREATRDDKSSTFMRVGQLGLGGSMTLPRGGFEVFTTFELGDLDRPFVAGHLYNAEARPPYELPAGKTRSTFRTDTTEGGSGVNEIRFEDAAGSEEIHFGASKDLTVRVENDQATTVAQDETVIVGGASKTTVGTVLTTTVGDNRQLTVRSAQRIDVGKDLSLAAGGSIDLTVNGTRKVTVGGDWLETTKGTFDRSVSDAQVITTIGGYDRKVVGCSSITVLGAWAEACGKTRSIDVRDYYETVVGTKIIKAQTVAVNCGAGYAETATREDVTCKGNRTDSAGAAVAVSAKSSISAKAKTITVTAEEELHVVAGKVELTLKKDGNIRVKAKTLDLRDVKNIHGEHRSN